MHWNIIHYSRCLDVHLGRETNGTDSFFLTSCPPLHHTVRFNFHICTILSFRCVLLPPLLVLVDRLSHNVCKRSTPIVHHCCYIHFSANSIVSAYFFDERDQPCLCSMLQCIINSIKILDCIRHKDNFKLIVDMRTGLKSDDSLQDFK